MWCKTSTASEFMSWAEENGWKILRNSHDTYLTYMSPSGTMYYAYFDGDYICYIHKIEKFS